MRIITNEALIKRNARIGQIAGLAGLLILIAGLILSFQSPEQGWLWLGTFILGFVLSQIGIYFGNRYVRQPRPDTALNQALKGLDKRFSLYHYNTPVSHLLIGPAGIWALFPRHQRGRIVYEKGRWRQKGGGLGLAYMKIFAQEGLGRPDLEIGAEIDALKKYLQEQLPEGSELPPIHAALLFTHPQAEIQAENAPIPTMPIGRFKEFIRKNSKQYRLAPELVNQIQQLFDGEKGE